MSQTKQEIMHSRKYQSRIRQGQNKSSDTVVPEQYVNLLGRNVTSFQQYVLQAQKMHEWTQRGSSYNTAQISRWRTTLPFYRSLPLMHFLQMLC